MAIRQTPSNRLLSNGSFSSRKVVPISEDVPIHTSAVGGEKVNQSDYYKQEKLTAGLNATDQHNYREAVKQFSLIKPDTMTSLFLAACARLELQYYTQAKEALDDLNKCFQLLSQEENTPPFVLELWHRRALAYRYLGRYDDAIEDYTQYIDRCRSLIEREEQNLCKGLIARGLTYLTLYELDTAMADIEEANELTKDKNPYYLCCRATVYATVFDIDKALANLEKASKSGCYEDPEALLQRAIVLTQLNRHNAALEDLNKALSLSGKPSQQSDICFQCGLNESLLNNKEQAIQWFSRAINYHPYNAQAYFRLGMIQAEKKQYKDALKSLDRAQELSPQQSDIYFQRAVVHENLDQLNQASKDRKRALQIMSSDYAIVIMLSNRLKSLREQMTANNISLLYSLELAMAYDGLLHRKRNLKTKLTFYDEAVYQYRDAIEADTKNEHPQALSLLALCHLKMNNVVEAHEVHLKFYNLLAKNKGAENLWKAYLLEVKDKMELGKIEPHLDQNAVSKLVHMEMNRRKQNADQKTFLYDTEDQNRNQLLFYERLRIDLANLIAAIGLLNLDRETIIRNIEGMSNRVSKITELLISGETTIQHIESRLNSDTKVNSNLIQQADYDTIKMKLNAIGNVGDMIDQLDVAQLVARHLCTRYRSQVICLRPNYNDIVSHNEHNEDDEETPSGPCWCCNSRNRNRVFSPQRSVFSNEKDIFQKLVTFAIAFIIKTLNTETVKLSSNEKSSRKDALATALVLIVSRAHSDLVISYHDTSANVPIDSSAVVKMLNESRQRFDDEHHLPTEWNLYEFFRAPGIYYYSDGETGKIYYYSSGTSMMVTIYGYRLGTKEEVNVFKRLNQQNQ